jgi:hypothetical protein
MFSEEDIKLLCVLVEVEKPSTIDRIFDTMVFDHPEWIIEVLFSAALMAGIYYVKSHSPPEPPVIVKQYAPETYRR